MSKPWIQDKGPKAVTLSWMFCHLWLHDIVSACVRRKHFEKHFLLATKAGRGQRRRAFKCDAERSRSHACHNRSQATTVLQSQDRPSSVEQGRTVLCRLLWSAWPLGDAHTCDLRQRLGRIVHKDIICDPLDNRCCGPALRRGHLNFLPASP